MLSRARRVSLFAVAAVSICASGVFGTAAAMADTNVAVAPPRVQQLTFKGTVNLGSLAGAQSSAKGQPKAGTPVQKKSAQPFAQARTPNPNPPPLPLQTVPGSPLGFVGITTAASAALNGFDVEPPDQGLCAHAGTVMEGVNLALAVYTESGITLKAPVSLNSFFGEAPAVSSDGTTTTYGPFLSDPRCYYDAQTARWFVTTLEIDVNSTTGALANQSHELIAVSQTSDPTGSYGVFSINSTNDGTNGTPSEPNCPCLGDQPRIGADANGFYISTDSYPIQGAFNSNGGEIYAISKPGLVAAANGAAMPPVVAIHNGAVLIQGNPANAVQPAETPEGASYAPDREYFLSTPDFNGFATSGGAGATSVVLWTLLNTSSLSSATPGVTLTDSIVPSEPFTTPVNAAQQPGPHPLGQSLGAPVSPLNVDDDRMQQVEYVRGDLYSSLSTGVGSGANARTGAAWFDVKTNDTSGKVRNQGYLATGNGASLLYPAIGLMPGKRGVMTFSVSGPGVYPSAAYVPFQDGPTGSTINVTAAGTAPEDGFTCYTPDGPPCRWGDYSAASSDGSGHIVIGDEMIPNVARDQNANWGTYLSSIAP
ncbi:MAG: hypothetical protein ACR2NR_23035 [Solirubrobacteraceae bacterium]